MLKKVCFLLCILLTLTALAGCDPYSQMSQTSTMGTIDTTASAAAPSATTEPTAHVHNYFGQTVAASCTEVGYMLHMCDCGDQFMDSYTDALGHNWGSWVTVKVPTETNEGLQERTCELCGSVSQQVIEKLGADHSHSYGETVVLPTCTEAGYTLHGCVCGESYRDTLLTALGHSFTDYVSNGDAGCTEDGTKTAECDRCGVLSTLVDPGTALGHEWLEWETIKEATTEEEGQQQRSCAVCAAVDNRVIEKLQQVHIHSYVATVVEPGCTDEGCTLYLCACGSSYREDIQPATGHDWGEWVVTIAPTTETEGAQKRTCTVCGATDNRVVEKLPEVHVHEYQKEKIAASCTENGYMLYTCVCGDSYQEITAEPKGHSWGEWYISVAPTTESEGQRARECVDCGLAETGAIEALNVDGGFVLVFWTESLGRNTEGCVMIYGQAGVTYNIDVYYKSGVSSAKGLEDQMADENGCVIWRWKVGPSTAAGTYKIVISGGGEEQTVYFTVVV